jgi:predicted RNase H-like HicB family nuclease
MAMARRREETVGISDAQYVCTFRPEAEGGYTVRCAAFPEIVTFGASLEEARAAAREAIELCIEVCQQEGRRLPPSDAAILKQAKLSREDFVSLL